MADQAPALTKNSNKSSLSNQQVIFNRHRRKIDKLRNQLENMKSECEKALDLYHVALKPLEKKNFDLITQFILKIRSVTQDPKSLNKKETEALQEILQNSLSIVTDLESYYNGVLHEELNVLYKELYGTNREDDFLNQLSDLEIKIKETIGLKDIDLSNLNIHDDPQEVRRKLMEALRGGIAEGIDMEIPSPPPRPKSKRELNKEQKVQELEILQNKCLNNIYKRLVKELHPDLEQDPERKAQKHKYMTQLTVAYEKQDLISLLAIESEWLGGAECTLEILNGENIKIYNALLKEQIEELQMELLRVHLNPRFCEILYLIDECPEMPLACVEEAVADSKELHHEYFLRMRDISGDQPLRALKKILARVINESAMDSMFGELDLESLFRMMVPQGPAPGKKRKK